MVHCYWCFCFWRLSYGALCESSWHFLFTINIGMIPESLADYVILEMSFATQHTIALSCWWDKYGGCNLPALSSSFAFHRLPCTTDTSTLHTARTSLQSIIAQPQHIPKCYSKTSPLPTLSSLEYAQPPLQTTAWFVQTWTSPTATRNLLYLQSNGKS